MKKEGEEKGKRAKAVEVKKCRRHILALATRKKRLKAKLTERFSNRQIQRDKGKNGAPKMTREKEKSERDEGIRRNDASSLDKRKFHRIAIGLLRKPVALSCLPTYTHLKMERYYIEEIKSAGRARRRQEPALISASRSLLLFLTISSLPAANTMAGTR